MKIQCKKCLLNKDSNEFNKDNKNKKRDYKKYFCKSCDSEIQKKRYQEKQDEIIEQVREYQENADEKTKNKIKQYKKNWREKQKAKVQKSPPPN